MTRKTSIEIVPVKWSGDSLYILDQTKLPHKQIFVETREWRTVVNAIKNMQVRGAPAIGITGAYGVALAAADIEEDDQGLFLKRLKGVADEIATARPTAVNLGWAVNRMMSVANAMSSIKQIKQSLIDEAVKIHTEDVEANRRIGALGAELLSRDGSIMTHCNAGALATGGYGTALGVIRAAWEKGGQIHVYATETRPLLQGARLTAWELVQMGIPTDLIVDSAAGSVMANRSVDCVVVGADRIAGNGDVANKIGTYSLSILAKEHNVPFYVAAPISTLDLSLSSGRDIPIEERSGDEVLRLNQCSIAPEGVGTRNPAFDVTPNKYVTAIITEMGVARSPYRESLLRMVENRKETLSAKTEQVTGDHSG
jgi:methylthioribose-1-phosphate isomerase